MEKYMVMQNLCKHGMELCLEIIGHRFSVVRQEIRIYRHFTYTARQTSRKVGFEVEQFSIDFVLVGVNERGGLNVMILELINAVSKNTLLGHVSKC